MPRPVAAAGLLAALALAAGCSDPPAARPLDESVAGTARPGTGGSTPTASTTPTAAVDPAVAKAVSTSFLRYWDGVLAAHSTRDPAHPVLRQHARGAAYSRVANAVRLNASRGYLRRGTVTHTPAVTQADDTTATLRDCADVTKWTIVNTRTGRPVPIGASDPRLLTTYRLELQGSRWVVLEATDGGGC